jgi:enoyl-CoA hydratase/carnithine racemase
MTEAVDLGLATYLSEQSREDALELAKTIAGKSPDAIRGMKRLLNNVVTPEDQAARVLLEESQAQDKITGGANQIEAVHANLEKRSPVFRDPSA